MKKCIFFCFFTKHSFVFVVYVLLFHILLGCSAASTTDTPNHETVTSTNPQSTYIRTTPYRTLSPYPTNALVLPTTTPTPLLPLPLLAFVMEIDPTGSDAHEIIYTIRADGTELTRLVNEPVNTCCPGWSPDGRLIAFLGRKPDDWLFNKLYVLNNESGEVLQIPTEHVGTFTWAPDSQRISYTEEVASPAYFFDSFPSKVNLVDLSTGQHSQLYDAPWPILRLMWSPSRDLILIVTSASGEDNWLHLLDLNGNLSRYQLFQRAGFDFAWHPSGQQIAYYTIVDSTHTRSDIRVINVDGTNDHILIESEESVIQPQWSPSGDLVAYLRNSTDDVYRLYVMDLRDRRTWLIPRGRGYPVWSSDGNYLAYFSETSLVQETGYGLYLYSLADDTARVLVEEYVTPRSFSWQPNP